MGPHPTRASTLTPPFTLQTRAVIISVNLYNGNYNYYCQARARCRDEFSRDSRACTAAPLSAY